MNLSLLIDSTGNVEWILLALLLVSFLIQGIYYLGIYPRLLTYTPPEKKRSSKGISVIICARNEAHHLEKYLPRVLDQKYPVFEVVVVNDGSSDGTEELLSALAAEHEHLRYTTIPDNGKFTHGKKLALTLGLKSARYGHVLLTDGDCYPTSDQWLRGMTSHLDSEREIVLGYGRYEKRKGWLNALIRYETLLTAVQYLSSALRGHPYMGVGRNLAYRKSLFFQSRGFARHYHIASGDDDLFVNEHANRDNTAIEIDPLCHTVSVPEDSFGDWIRQKQRHLSAGTMYTRGSQFRIGTELISRLLFYSLFAVLCATSGWVWMVLILFGVFQGIRMSVLKLGMRRLNERDLLLPSLLLDPVLPFMLGLVWFSNIFVTKYQPWS
jgi:biofilm PGA synthesis N-glycosyltransferase PgaC